MIGVTQDDIGRMRDQVFFEGAERRRRLSRYWLLLVLAAVIASAGVVSDSTATVIGAMIVAPLMTPILGVVLGVVLADTGNLRRCLLLLIAGAAAVVVLSWLLGLFVPFPVVAATNGQVAARVTPRVVDLVAALATGAVGSVALARSDTSDTLPGVAIAISLVPPLGVVGLTLESGAPRQALGAFVLFSTNVAAILASGIVVMALYRAYQPREQGPGPAFHRAAAAGWTVVGVSATGEQVLIEATGPEPAPAWPSSAGNSTTPAWLAWTSGSTWPWPATSPCRSKAATAGAGICQTRDAPAAPPTPGGMAGRASGRYVDERAGT